MMCVPFDVDNFNFYITLYWPYIELKVVSNITSYCGDVDDEV